METRVRMVAKLERHIRATRLGGNHYGPWTMRARLLGRVSLSVLYSTSLISRARLRTGRRGRTDRDSIWQSLVSRVVTAFFAHSKVYVSP